MSRTYRKRAEKFESYYGWSCGIYKSELEEFNEKEKLRKKALYYTKTCKWISHKLPKSYRKLVNKNRRNKDKQALYNFVYNGNEDACFDPWNSKTCNSWGYW